MQFLDLIQEATWPDQGRGEVRPHHGFKFSTYATLWNKQAITRADYGQARTIRIPVHMVETINKVKKVSSQLLHQNGTRSDGRGDRCCPGYAGGQGA